MRVVRHATPRLQRCNLPISLPYCAPSSSSASCPTPDISPCIETVEASSPPADGWDHTLGRSGQSASTRKSIRGINPLHFVHGNSSLSVCLSVSACLSLVILRVCSPASLRVCSCASYSVNLQVLELLLVWSRSMDTVCSLCDKPGGMTAVAIKHFQVYKYRFV